jgi:hypothetical protein
MNVADDGVEHAGFGPLNALELASCPFHGNEDATIVSTRRAGG